MHDLYALFWERIRPLALLEQEIVMAVYVDKSFHELATCYLGSGTADFCHVHPRQIFRIAVQLNAFGVILGHTHPSGELHPSYEDITATQILRRAAACLRIPLLGHLVCTPEGWKNIEDSS